MYKILHCKTVTADKLEVLNELQKIQVEYSELHNLDEVVDFIDFMKSISTICLMIDVCVAH